MSIARPVFRTGLVAAVLALCVSVLGPGGAVRAPHAFAAQADLLGHAQIANVTDRNSAGMAEAFVTSAQASGTLRSLHLFVDRTSTATAVQLGVYSDVAGAPGQLLAASWVRYLRDGAWNAANVTPTTIEAGRVYWIVMLGIGGDLAFRDHCCGGGSGAVTSPDADLSALPQTWRSGTAYSDGPASLYGSTDTVSEEPPTDGEATITADLSSDLQTLDGIGVNANVHAWENGRLKPAIDRLAVAGITTWRVIIDRCDVEATNDDDDPGHFNLAYYNDAYERGKMADLWNTLAYVESQPGAKVVLNCMGGTPAWMGGRVGNSSIDADKEDEWVEMIASLAYYGRSVKGLDLKLLAPSNEIDWDGNEGPKIPSQQYVRLLNKLSKRLDALGLGDIRFVGPDTADAGKAADEYFPAMAADPVVMAKVARVGVHAYDGNSRGIGRAIAESDYADLPWWLTEFSVWCGGCDSGAPNPGDWGFAAGVGEQIFGFLQQGASGLLLYDGWDGYYEHHQAFGYWGAMAHDALSGTYAPRKSLSVLEQFAQFMPSGSVRVVSASSDEDLDVEVFRDPSTQRVTLVVKNDGPTPMQTTGTISGPHSVTALHTYVTNAAFDFAAGEDVAVQGGKFSAAVPADSIMTLTGTPADDIAPTVSIDAPATGATVSGSVAVTATASDDVGVARVEFAVDGAPVGTDDSAPYGFDWDTRPLTEGPHILTAVAVDTAEHVSQSARVSVTVVHRSTTIQNGPSASTADPTPTFTFSSSEPEAGFECRLDGPGAGTGTFQECTTPHTLATLADGDYVFRVRAVDRAGNPDPTPATRGFTVDTRAPTPPQVIAPADGSAQRDSTLVFAGLAEPGTTVLVDETGVTRGTVPVAGDGAWTLSISAVSDGLHEYAVSARDGAGNGSAGTVVRVVVDTVPADTTIAVGPSGPIVESSPAFTFTASEPDARFECRLDGPGVAVGGYAECASPRRYVSLGDGEYTLRVRAIDRAGNVDPDPATRSFTVDTSAPDTLLTAGQAGPTSNPSPSFQFTSAEGGARFECRLDRGADAGEYAGCTSPKAFPALEDGAYTVYVRAIDPAGNVDPTPATRSFVVDTRAPSAPVVTAPADDSVQRSSTIDFTGSAEPGAIVIIQEGAATRAEGTASQADAWSLQVRDATVGPHTYSLRARDAAGNNSPAREVRVRVDDSEPETTMVSGPDGTTSTASPTFTFSSSKPESTFQCRLDGPAGPGEWAVCVTPRTLPDLADGPYTLSVRAVDAAGNTDSTPVTRSFTVDTTAADTSITSGPEGATATASPSFGFTSAEFGVSFECRLDGPGGVGEWNGCVSPRAFPGLADGTYTVLVRSVDAAGNRDSSPARRSFDVDTVVADTTIVGGPTGPTNVAGLSFSLASTEVAAGFECRLDGPAGTVRAYGVCASPVTYAELVDGDYTLFARAVDAAGNRDATPATRSFTMDTVAPDTSIDSGPDGVVTDGGAAFSFSAREAGARLECSLLSAAFDRCESGKRYDALADGPYTFAVRAVDAAGNVDPTPALRSFTVLHARVPEDAPRPAATLTPARAPVVARPAFRRTVVARPVKGTITVRLPGAKTATALTTEQSLPVGSTVDAKRGEVRITALTATDGAVYSAAFRGGVFSFTQRDSTVELRLTEVLAPCTAGSPRGGKPKVRRLWGVGGSSFRIRGAYSTTMSRNGTWLVEDTCAGTTTRVIKGLVEVAVPGRATKVKVRAGKRFLATARGRRSIAHSAAP